ncbi:hypothetical protein QBC36DRAFT_99061 [Triangularia setosa]|uniref:Uncharacterized protein n=1 Tax=Triangularia setosa TaxID=2587417 RepID=A0AAN6VYZ1_9PEZI|nr:hypothetical protein QBC36DRAFT_99061 [Podospora setosa]
MVGSDITIDLDRSSTPFPRSRRSERAHEQVEDFNKRLPSPARFSDSSRKTRGLSLSPPRYRSPARITSSTFPLGRATCHYFKETCITQSRRTTTYHPPSPVSRLGLFPSGPRSEYVRPRTPTRAPIGSSPSRYRTAPSVVDVRPPETYSSSRQYDSYPSGPISEYVLAPRTSTWAKSPARRGASSPRLIKMSYKDYGAYRGDYRRS